MAAPDDEGRFALLARHLDALASPTRLELLHALRRPRPLHDIRVGPSQVRGTENPDRPLSRQAVTRHLEQLLEAGLVARVGTEGRARGDTYVLNHERLFAVVDEIRGLAKLRPLTALPRPEGTIEGGPADVVTLPPRPRLVVAYGRDDGVAYALEGGAGTRWRIGRGPHCEIRLDYDAFASSENSTLERAGDGFVVHDLPRSRNGTWVNWRRLPSGGSQRLEDGDVLTVGRSTLVLQC